MAAQNQKSEKRRPKKKSSTPKWVKRFLSGLLSIVTGLTAIVLIAYSGYVIYDSLYTNQAAFSSWDLSQYRPSLDSEGKISFEELLEINPDTVGWIKINNTNIDYPVVQGKDDLEYASKDVFGNSSLSGSIYLTTANTRDFTNSYNLIYGHHMANGAMFGDIEKYEDYDFFMTHQDGILITTQGTYDLKIFARIGTDAYDSKIYSAGDRKSNEFPEFLEYVKSLAIQWQDGTDIYDITDHVRTYLLAREQNIAQYGHFVWGKMPQEAIDNGMQLLALSTCADATTNGRQLLFATMKIRTAPLPEDMVNDNPDPQGEVRGHGQADYWGLLTLLCLIMIVIIFIPGLAIPAKYDRLRLMKKANKEGSRFRTRAFRDKMLIGVILEAGVTVFSIILFIMKEDLRKPMTVIDIWTPVMLILMAVMILIDILLLRYREKKRGDRPA